MKPRLLIVAFILPCFFVTFFSLQAFPAQSSGPVSYASVSQVNSLLAQLEQASQSMQTDLTKLRIDKWKADSSTKRGTESDVESIQRNLQSALPEMINQLRSSPESLPGTFKMYRNLDALYGVFSSIAESAGAFGSKDDYQILQNDLAELERSRRAIADRMDNLANAKEQELSQLRTQLHNIQATSASANPAKKTIVDDDAPPKPVKKKTTTTKKKPATSTSTTSSPAATAPPTSQPH